MERLLNLLKEAERISQDIKFRRISEAYNAADLKKTDEDGYIANTKSFEQYVAEVNTLLGGLNDEIVKIVKSDLQSFKNSQTQKPISAGQEETDDPKKAQDLKNLKIKLSNDITSKYLPVEYKLFLCIKLFYDTFNIFTGLPLDVKSRLADSMKATKTNLLNTINSVRDEFKNQQSQYTCIQNYKGDIIPVNKADDYFKFDNLKDIYKTGIDILGSKTSFNMSRKDAKAISR